MVMLARGMVAKAKLVVLDEPTASLTDTEIADVFAAIKKLQQAGVAIIYVSHRLEEILNLISRVAVMCDGKLVEDRATDTLDEAGLVELISGQKTTTIQETPDRKACHFDNVVLRVEGLFPKPGAPTMSLTVHKGEIVGLAGLAGSGRSEVLRQIIGADTIGGLSHMVRGDHVKIKSPRDAWSNGIALVPEDRRTQGAVLQFTIACNITLASLRRHRVSKNVMVPSPMKENRVTRQLVEELKIKVSNTDTRIGTLSGGNQQKAIFARCLAADADVLLLDEPTHGVDVAAKAEIYRVIRELADDGKAIVVVSSELKEIEGLVDRALVLQDGVHAATIEGEGVTEDAVLKHCFSSQAR